MRTFVRCDWCNKKFRRHERKTTTIGCSRYRFCSLKCEIEYKEKVLRAYAGRMEK